MPFVIIVLLMMAMNLFSLNVLSTARAYAASESSWSKGQRDAIYFLERYSHTRNPKDYYAYVKGISVQQAYRDARVAMDAPIPDREQAVRGILNGGSEAEDISGIYYAFTLLRNVGSFKDAIDAWEETDRYLRTLPIVARRLRQGILLNNIDEEEIAILRGMIHKVDSEVRIPLAKFSKEMAAATRDCLIYLGIINVLVGLVLLLLLVRRLRILLEQSGRYEDELQSEKNRIESTLDAVGDAVISTDLRGNILYMNAVAHIMLSARKNTDAQPMRLDKICTLYDMSNSESGDVLTLKALIVQASGKQQFPLVKLHIPHNGTDHMISMVLTPVPDPAGKIGGLVFALRDKSVEMQYINNLSWQAAHDALTGLYNRREFEHRLEKILQSRAENPNIRYALLFVDLDQFKLINDTHGHSAGDELLKQLAQLLSDQLDTEDILARLGGDEFGVLIEIPRGETARQKAQRLLSAIDDNRFRWQEIQFSVTASIGLVLLDENASTLAEAMQMVDIACYLAKEKGRNRIQIYGEDDAELKVRSHEMSWVQRLRDSIEQDLLCLYTQEVMPISAAAQEEGRHFEVLLRLYEPDGSIILPGQFIPAAERFGLMPEIDRLVIRKTFETLADMRREGKNEVAFCAINLSGTSFGDEALLKYIREQLQHYRIPPGQICFEITETSAIGNFSKAASFISALKSMGCHFALDDFGVGMSSFGYLKQLDVDYLKIDGSFVKDMITDQTDRTMVEMINNIGHVTGKKTIAEFVGSAEILEELKRIGVDYAQGYHVGKPTPFSKLPVFTTRSAVGASLPTAKKGQELSLL